MLVDKEPSKWYMTQLLLYDESSHFRVCGLASYPYCRYFFLIRDCLRKLREDRTDGGRDGSLKWRIATAGRGMRSLNKPLRSDFLVLSSGVSLGMEETAERLRIRSLQPSRNI